MQTWPPGHRSLAEPPSVFLQRGVPALSPSLRLPRLDSACRLEAGGLHLLAQSRLEKRDSAIHASSPLPTGTLDGVQTSRLPAQEAVPVPLPHIDRLGLLG